MARAQATDPLQKFRFHLKATALEELTGDPLQPGSGGGIANPEAGFKAVGAPEYTIETADYREGIMTYTMKFPGIPSTNEITCSRGSAQLDSAFHDWALRAIEGQTYRSDLTTYHFTRPGRSTVFSRDRDLSPANAKLFLLYEALPTAYKPSDDLEADGNDVSLQEVKFKFEKFKVRTVAAA